MYKLYFYDKVFSNTKNNILFMANESTVIVTAVWFPQTYIYLLQIK